MFHIIDSISDTYWCRQGNIYYVNKTIVKLWAGVEYMSSLLSLKQCKTKFFKLYITIFLT